MLTLGMVAFHHLGFAVIHTIILPEVLLRSVNKSFCSANEDEVYVDPNKKKKSWFFAVDRLDLATHSKFGGLLLKLN